MRPSFPGRILLIDDDPDIVSIYQEFLTQAGYDVDIARDGEEGLTKILQGGYDLILLDIMMPKIDGLGLLSKLKLRSSVDSPLYNGPIIVLSVLNQPNIIEEALKLGANGYLNKADLTPDQALAKISEYFSKPPRETTT